MDNPSVVVAVIALFAGPIAAFVGWFLNRRKTDTDISNSIATASGDAVAAIKAVMVTLEEELRETQRELSEFKAQNRELEVSLQELQRQNEKLIEQNATLAAEIVELRRLVDLMKKRQG